MKPSYNKVFTIKVHVMTALQKIPDESREIYQRE